MDRKKSYNKKELPSNTVLTTISKTAISKKPWSQIINHIKKIHGHQHQAYRDGNNHLEYDMAKLPVFIVSFKH